MATREVIESQQLAQLRRLLAAILPANRFYQQKLAGINPAIASLEDFSKRFPFTTKQELVADQQQHPPFGTNLTFALDQYTRFHQTSGTTSKPLRWLDTPESWGAMIESWKQVYLAAGVGRGDRVYFAFSFGPFIGFWLAFDAAQQLGCLCLPGGGLGTEARLRAIVDNEVTVLCCTPSYALRLAEVATKEKTQLHPGKIKTIIVAGEPGGSIPATRERLEKLWPGTRIFDHHGMTETGPVTHECPDQPGVLQIMESAYYAEVIDSSGAPVKSGETGELILTTLNRTGSPLLRYRTGDLVRPFHSPLSTHHSSLLQGGILGRTDDMVIVRGVNVYPSAVEDIMSRFSEIAEYQVAVDISRSMAEMVLQIEMKGQGTDEKNLVKQIQDALHTAFNLRVPIVVAATGTLPRFEMKAKRWIIKSGLAG